MLFHELLDAVPQRWDGFDVLVQAQDEAVLLVVVGHVLEGIVVDVTKQLNARLNAPVPLVVLQDLVAEEEAGFVTAHVAVADGVAVDDLLFVHLLTDLCGFLHVDPLWKRPMLFGNFAIPCVARHERGGDLLEGVIEVGVIQEDPVVVVLAIESILNLADRTSNFPDIRISRQRHKCRVHAGTGSGSVKGW